MKILKDEIRHILDYDSEETVALTFKTKARLVNNIVSAVEDFYSQSKKPITELEVEMEEPSQQYHLNCEKCGNTFWSKEAFPKPQLCEKCKNRKGNCKCLYSTWNRDAGCHVCNDCGKRI